MILKIELTFTGAFNLWTRGGVLPAVQPAWCGQRRRGLGRVSDGGEKLLRDHPGLPQQNPDHKGDQKGQRATSCSVRRISASPALTAIKILQVEKLMNRLLYNQYKLKKASILQNATCPQVERTLYHGTSEDSVKEICIHGFNRSFCGKNGMFFSIYLLLFPPPIVHFWQLSFSSQPPSMVKACTSPSTRCCRSRTSIRRRTRPGTSSFSCPRSWRETSPKGATPWRRPRSRRAATYRSDSTVSRTISPNRQCLSSSTTLRLFQNISSPVRKLADERDGLNAANSFKTLMCCSVQATLVVFFFLHYLFFKNLQLLKHFSKTDELDTTAPAT